MKLPSTPVIALALPEAEPILACGQGFFVWALNTILESFNWAATMERFRHSIAIKQKIRFIAVSFFMNKLVLNELAMLIKSYRQLLKIRLGGIFRFALEGGFKPIERSEMVMKLHGI